MEFEKRLDEILKQVEKPGRYIGGEVKNLEKKEEETSRLCLSGPVRDRHVYRGMQILYNAVTRPDHLKLRKSILTCS